MNTAETQRKYRARNKDRINQKKMEWRESRREILIEQSRESYQRRKSEIMEAQRIRRRKNPIKTNARTAHIER